MPDRHLTITPGLWHRWAAANLAAFALSHILFSLGNVLVDALGGHDSFLGLLAHIVALVMGGLIVGVFQLLALRPNAFPSKPWIFLSIVSYTLSFSIGFVVGLTTFFHMSPIFVIVVQTFIGALAGAVAGELSGIALIKIR